MKRDNDNDKVRYDKISLKLSGRKHPKYCNHCKYMRERQLSESTKAKLSDARKGIRYSLTTLCRMSKAQSKRFKDRPEDKLIISNANKRNKYRLGKKHSKEARLKMSKSHMGLKRSEESTRKWILANHIRPNKPEKILSEIVKPFGYTYTGDGKFVIDGLCPDFTNYDRHKLIELFGVYWHRNDNGSYRIKRLANAGYDTLIIWENELKESEENLIKKIINFTEGDES